MALSEVDAFKRLPNEVSELKCKVCGTQCKVRRGVHGPMNFASAVGGLKTAHDSFVCPFSKEKWHEDAVELYVEMQDSHSPSLKK